MNYLEITITAPVADIERAADAMRAATGAGVAIETPFTQADLESDALLSTSGVSVLRAYVDGTANERAIVGDVRQALAGAGIAAEVRCAMVAEEDWAEAWKEHFHVERFGRRIVVVPSWRKYEAQAGDVVLTLDPGMAFGTGQHETTRMCLEALEDAVTPGVRVLDVGCGSGILSIAAAKLGAREVYALDVDENCVRITNENARANGVERRIHAASTADGAPWPRACADGRIDIVVANIIARVIIDLMPNIVAALAPAGRVVLSGIIASREQGVVDAFVAAGFSIDSVRAMGEWRCIQASQS